MGSRVIALPIESYRVALAPSGLSPSHMSDNPDQSNQAHEPFNESVEAAFSSASETPKKADASKALTLSPHLKVHRDAHILDAISGVNADILGSTSALSSMIRELSESVESMGAELSDRLSAMEKVSSSAMEKISSSAPQGTNSVSGYDVVSSNYGAMCSSGNEPGVKHSGDQNDPLSLDEMCRNPYADVTTGTSSKGTMATHYQVVYRDEDARVPHPNFFVYADFSNVPHKDKQSTGYVDLRARGVGITPAHVSTFVKIAKDLAQRERVPKHASCIWNMETGGVAVDFRMFPEKDGKGTVPVYEVREDAKGTVLTAVEDGIAHLHSFTGTAVLVLRMSAFTVSNGGGKCILRLVKAFCSTRPSEGQNRIVSKEQLKSGPTIAKPSGYSDSEWGTIAEAINRYLASAPPAHVVAQSLESRIVRPLSNASKEGRDARSERSLSPVSKGQRGRSRDSRSPSPSERSSSPVKSKSSSSSRRARSPSPKKSSSHKRSPSPRRSSPSPRGSRDMDRSPSPPLRDSRREPKSSDSSPRNNPFSSTGYTTRVSK